MRALMLSTAFLLAAAALPAAPLLVAAAALPLSLPATLTAPPLITIARSAAAVALPVAGSSDNPLEPGWNIRACKSQGFSPAGTSRV